MNSFRRRCRYASHAVERRRYPEKRPRAAPLPARSLHKRDDRSRFEEKASGMWREREQYGQRRRAFFAWADAHAETLGAVLPVRRGRAETEIRFANVNPAVSFFISTTSICVSVSHAGRCYDLRVFNSEPRRVVGGYEDDNVRVEFVVVYPDRHMLWECEVFDSFKRWYVDEFASATELLMHCGGSRWSMSATLYPGKYATENNDCVRVALFICAPKTTYVRST